jgi:hypothetical protein
MYNELGAKYPHDYIGALDDALWFFTASCIFILYFLGFYGLMLVLKATLKAFFWALAFGLSTSQLSF